jgi:hypothetical protein
LFQLPPLITRRAFTIVVLAVPVVAPLRHVAPTIHLLPTINLLPSVTTGDPGNTCFYISEPSTVAGDPRPASGPPDALVGLVARGRIFAGGGLGLARPQPLAVRQSTAQ